MRHFLAERTRTVPTLLLAWMLQPAVNAQQPQWRLEAVQRRDALGITATWIADLNGDGTVDFATSILPPIGSPEFSSVQLRSGRDGTLLREITSSSRNDGFGQTVASVPDLDGDGLDDLVVGASLRETSAALAGTLELFSSATGALLRVHDQSNLPRVLGGLVIRMRDVDGDGVDDYLATMRSFDVVLFSGATGGLIRRHTSPTGVSNFGEDVADIGDVDFDGVPDYVILDPFSVDHGSFGWARIYSGASGSLIRSLDNFAQLGGIAALNATAAGDIDGDGAADLFLASGDPIPDGMVVAASGATGATLWHVAATPGLAEGFARPLAAPGDLDGDGDPDLICGGATALHWFDQATGARTGSTPLAFPASALDTHRDVDGDGRADLLVGLSSADDVDQDAGAGRVLLIDNATAAIRFDVRGRSHTPQIGATAVVLEDRDGDGWREIALAVPGGDGDNRGVVLITSGRDGSEVLRITSAIPSDEFGAALAAMGDRDGDGFSDLLVGAPGDPAGGRADIVSSSTGALLLSIGAPLGAVRFGHAIAAEHDSNGRWIGAIGDPAKTISATSSGRVQFHDLTTGALIAAHDAWTTSVGFGHALAALADTNRDGVPDFAVGATHENLTQLGSITLVSGADGTRRWRRLGAPNGDAYGWSVERIGDLDGDGIEDLLTGNPTASASAGMVTARSGRDGTRLFRLIGPTPPLGQEFEFGKSLTQLGDVDRDGIDDFAVGLPGWYEEGRTGAVEVYSSRMPALLKRFLDTEGSSSAFGGGLLHPGLSGTTQVGPDRRPDLGAGCGIAVVNPFEPAARSSAVLWNLSAHLLDITPRTAAAGEVVTLTQRGGPAGAFAGLFALAVAGTVINDFVAFGTLDSLASFTVSDTVPSGLSGLDATFRGYTIGWTGKLESSSDETVLFE